MLCLNRRLRKVFTTFNNRNIFSNKILCRNPLTLWFGRVEGEDQGYPCPEMLPHHFPLMPLHTLHLNAPHYAASLVPLSILPLRAPGAHLKLFWHSKT